MENSETKMGLLHAVYGVVVSDYLAHPCSIDTQDLAHYVHPLCLRSLPIFHDGRSTICVP